MNLILLVVFLCLITFTSLAKTPEAWMKGIYSYKAEQVTLNTVLEDFTQSYGVELNNTEPSEIVIDLSLSDVSPFEFLNRISLKYKIQWFYYDQVLYISPVRERESRSIELGTMSTAEAKAVLKSIGLFDERFGWGEFKDKNVISVSGPRKYVDLIESFLSLNQDESENPERSVLMAFPLKYVSVADKILNYRGQNITIPGLARVVEKLITGTSQPSVLRDSELTTQDIEKQNSNVRSVLFEKVSRDKKSMPVNNSRIIVSADPVTNSILINGPEEQYNQYIKIINMLDQPRKLIGIDAVIVDIDTNQLKRFSSMISNRSGSVSYGTGMLTGAGNLYIRDPGRFWAELNALEGRGDATIVANPVVTTLENHPAILDFSKTAYINSIGERVASVTPVEAGISLRVTPRVVDGASKIQLSVDIEDGDIAQTQDGKILNVSRGSINTEAIVNASQSLVLGGIHTEQTRNQKNSIPVLGALPVIGGLFSSNDSDINNNERLFIITPRIIDSYTAKGITEFASPSDNQITSANELFFSRENDVLKNEIRDFITTYNSGVIKSGFSKFNPENKISQVCGLRDKVSQHYHVQWLKSEKLMVAVIRHRSNSGDIGWKERFYCNDNNVLALATSDLKNKGGNMFSYVFMRYNSFK